MSGAQSWALSIRVEKAYPGFRLEVEIEVGPGITALFGPSGSGKTTIADLVAGIRTPDAGRIALGGDLLYEENSGICLKPERRGVGYVFQDALLFPHMTVRRNLLYGVDTDEDGGHFGEVSELLDLDGLLERHPATLSGGEARRVAIGRALLSGPRVLILDEPLAGIDPARRQAFFPYLEKLRAEAPMPILYITHQTDEILRLADRAVLMAAGKVVAAGTPEDLSLDPAARAVLGLADAGVVLGALVAGEKDGLTVLTVPGARILSSAPHLKEGDRVRLRILARDIAIARTRPEDTSVLNILKCKIVGIDRIGDGEIDVMLDLQDDPADDPADDPGDGPAQLVARITRASHDRLELRVGETLYAMIKAVAVARSFES